MVVTLECLLLMWPRPQQSLGQTLAPAWWGSTLVNSWEHKASCKARPFLCSFPLLSLPPSYLPPRKPFPSTPLGLTLLKLARLVFLSDYSFTAVSITLGWPRVGPLSYPSKPFFFALFFLFAPILLGDFFLKKQSPR